MKTCTNYDESYSANCNKGVDTESEEKCQIMLKHWLYTIVYRLENMKIRESVITNDEMMHVGKLIK